MIMAMPLKPALQIRNHHRLQNENPSSSCKVFHFVDVWDGPPNLRMRSDIILKQNWQAPYHIFVTQ